MKPFRERNPVIIGAISITVLAALLLAAFNAASLPLIGGGTVYKAAFSEASGLKPGDEVRVAGVRVGAVESMELDGNQVVAEFRVDTPSQFGTETGAEIKIKTLLGDMFLALTPAGEGQLEDGATIPRERTRSAFDVVSAFEGLAQRAETIDTDQLGEAFDTLAELTDDTPQAFQGTLRGLSRLSQTVASRNEEIGTLLQNLDTVSGTLAARDDDLIELMQSSDVLLRALVARREAVNTLLVSTSRFSEEITRLVRESRADLKPALDNLQGVVDVLLKNQANLDESLRLLAPFYRVFANTLGTGPWFDTFIANFPPAPATPLQGLDSSLAGGN
jgi:phospholipid/cholesterol/gamma-HCH transport system substrate-binding protein